MNNDDVPIKLIFNANYRLFNSDGVGFKTINDYSDKYDMAMLLYVQCCQSNQDNPNSDDVLLFEMTGYKVLDARRLLSQVRKIIIDHGIINDAENVKKGWLKNGDDDSYYFIDLNSVKFNAYSGCSLINKNRIARF